MFSLFKKSKADSDCCNNKSNQSLESDIMVLGNCCKKSTESFTNVKEAVQELGLDSEVINVGDNAIIAQYAVMQTPALVIKNKVFLEGKYIDKESALTLLKENY